MSYHVIMDDKNKQDYITDDRGRYIVFSQITNVRKFCIRRNITISKEGVISKKSLIERLGGDKEVVLDPDPNKNYWKENVIKVIDLKG